MLVKTHQHLYQVRSFDSFNNVYAILVTVKDGDMQNFSYVYGHYYNKFNDFIYKKIINDKVDDNEVYICSYSNLLHYTTDSIIYSSSLRILKDQIETYIQFVGRLPVLFRYDPVTQSLITLIDVDELRRYVQIKYNGENECLFIKQNKNKKYII